MDITIAKGAFAQVRVCEPAAWPQAAQSAVISIGFRNLPKDGFQWVRETEITEDGDARETGRVVVSADMNMLFSAGLHSMLNDAHASVKFGAATGADLAKLWAECQALADKRLAGLIAGNVRTGGGGKRLDEVSRRVREIAERRIAAIAVKTGKKLDADAFKTAVTEFIADKKRQLTELAESQLRTEAAELAELE